VQGTQIFTRNRPRFKRADGRRSPSTQRAGGSLRWSGRPLRGSGRPLRGSGRPLRGSGRPLRGSGRPLRGSGRPLRGMADPCRVGGNVGPALDNQTPSAQTRCARPGARLSSPIDTKFTSTATFT